MKFQRATELAFWIFLLDQGPEKRDWFTSWEYRLWSICSSRSSVLVRGLDRTFFLSCLGGIATIFGMPLTALAARHHLVTVRVVYPSLSVHTSPLSPRRCLDRRLDLPRWCSQLVDDQRSLHLRPHLLPCLSSPCQGRGCRS